MKYQFKFTLFYVYVLRWLITVSGIFQEVDFDGSLLPLFITWRNNHGVKKLSNYRWTRWYHFRDTIATLWPAKNTLNFCFQSLYFKNDTVKFFYVINIWWAW